MNQKLLNILLLSLLLTGCSSFMKMPDGTVANKNAPIFVKPNTNSPVVNKAPVEATPSAGRPAIVNFNSEKYIMVKESDLNRLVEEKTKEAILNSYKKIPNTNDILVNNANTNGNVLNNGSIDVIPTGRVPTVETIAIKPQQESVIGKYVATVLVLLTFILGVGWLVYKNKLIAAKEKKSENQG
jgi:PBP1b-binding outer membrane lipoprotein LpoB